MGDFWRARRVLVTGHTGFKGAWLSLWLQSLGAEVTGLALEPPTEPSLFERAGVAGGMEDRRGDVRNLQAVAKVLEDARPQVVFHMAAQSLVRASYADPLGTFAVNVMGVANVLEAARARNADHSDRVEAVVVITSDKCYENDGRLQGYREGDPLGGHDPYSASKGCAEIVVSSLSRSFAGQGGPLIASARAGNVIGGGDWAMDRLVPDALAAFERKLALVIRNPRAVRPWQHVLEPLAGYLQLAERLAGGDRSFAEAWNFGPDRASERPVSEIADKLVALWDGKAEWRADESPQPHEAGMLTLDSSKSRERLGWRPQLSLDEALELTVRWRQGAAGASAAAVRELTLGQIGRYAARTAARTPAEALS
jgi:CDP-glucose 4,6-dehydratase